MLGKKARGVNPLGFQSPKRFKIRVPQQLQKARVMVAPGFWNSTTLSAPAVKLNCEASMQATWYSGAAWDRRQLAQWQKAVKMLREPSGSSTE